MSYHHFHSSGNPVGPMICGVAKGSALAAAAALEAEAPVRRLESLLSVALN
jgi:hypothetical protein